MKAVVTGLQAFALCCVFAVLSLSSLTAQAQSCQTSGELDDATRSAMTAAGQRYFEMAAKGDVASMRQNSIPRLGADFSAVEDRVKDRQQDLAGAAVMKSLVAKYPELRDAFSSVVARAVDSAGHDYGTLLAMKDLK